MKLQIVLGIVLAMFTVHAFGLMSVLEVDSEKVKFDSYGYETCSECNSIRKVETEYRGDWRTLRGSILPQKTGKWAWQSKKGDWVNCIHNWSDFSHVEIDIADWYDLSNAGRHSITATTMAIDITPGEQKDNLTGSKNNSLRPGGETEGEVTEKKSRQISSDYFYIWNSCRQIEQMAELNMLADSIGTSRQVRSLFLKMQRIGKGTEHEERIAEDLRLYELFYDAALNGKTVEAKQLLKVSIDSTYKSLESVLIQQNRLSWLERVNNASHEAHYGDAAVLDDNIVVKLEGIRRHHGDDKRFWAADGTLLEKSLYKTIGKNLPKEEGKIHYELTAKVSGQDDVSVSWGAAAGRNGMSAKGPVGYDGKKISGLNVRTVGFVHGVTGATIRVGVSSKPWKTVVTHGSKQREKNYTTNYGDVVIGKAFEKKGKTFVSTVGTFINKVQQYAACRITGLSRSGKEEVGETIGSDSDDLEGLTYAFNSPTSDMKEFRLQVRPYQWVEFDGVSFAPGKSYFDGGPLVRIFPYRGKEKTQVQMPDSAR